MLVSPLLARPPWAHGFHPVSRVMGPERLPSTGWCRAQPHPIALMCHPSEATRCPNPDETLKSRVPG